MPPRTPEKIEKTEKNNDNSIENGRKPSYSYPTILFLYVLIFIITPYIGEVAGLILFFGLMGVSFWAAVSLKQYNIIKKNYPAETRYEYVANMVIFPVIVPLVIFLIVLFWKAAV